MSGHKTTSTQLERYHLIDTIFSDGKAHSFGQILGILHETLRDERLSESSVRRDFRYLREKLAAPLVYDEEAHGWKYTKPYKLPAEAFSDDELLLLFLIKQVIESSASGNYLHTSFSRLLDSLAPASAFENKSQLTTLLERFAISPRPRPAAEDQCTEKIVAAIKHNYMLDFNYNSRWEPEEKHRKIQPYQLVLDAGAVYLYGASCREPENPRLFNVSRMHNVEIIKTKTFTLPQNFRFREDFEKGRFGAFQYDEWYEFKIIFYGEARNEVREWIWADDQRLEEDPEHGTTTITFTSSQWIPIQRWLLSFGENARPLAPGWFVEAWKTSVQNMGT
ncbi:MAG: WYL domain-containing protein [Treponema sp.]|nr:WYL domain-containing protein [Treponema sp.]